MSAKDRLVQAMLQDGCPDQMIDSARAGLYDDVESPIVFPMRQLVDDLRAIGRHMLARRVINGEFDSTYDEHTAVSGDER